MKMMLLPPFLLLMLSHVTICTASLVGDEFYGRMGAAEGVFWVFTSGGISIVNPNTCQIEHSFDKDNEGERLPHSWNKGVYMQVKTALSEEEDDDAPIQANPGELDPYEERQLRTKSYILINSGTHVNAKDSSNGENGRVFVLDTSNALKYPVLSKIPVGSSPTEAYAIHNRNQFWTHSQDDGYYYVVDLEDDVTQHTGHPIKAKVTTSHKAQLLWDIGIEPETLSVGDRPQIGYSNSEGEQALFILDIREHTQLSAYDYSKDVLNNTCPGTASIAYSALNQHLYLECVGTGGILEYDVSRPRSPLFIEQHVHIGGVLRETPDEKFVTATDKTTNTMHFFAPQQTGVASTDPYHIDAAGHPEAPVFYESPETLDYIACMPQTQQTNKKVIDMEQVQDDGLGKAVRCDYFNGCSQAQTQDDVNLGMCLYRQDFTSTAGQARGPLATALPGDQSAIDNGEEPWNRACNRCRENSHFGGSAGTCTCTLDCGACADDEDYPDTSNDPLLQQTGVLCLDVKDAQLGVIHAASLIRGAGAVKHKRATKDDPACGFAEPTRAHKRGNNVYDASISNVPHPALVVVDMHVMTLKCHIQLPGDPQQVIYVPTNYHYKKGAITDDDSLSGGIIALIVIASILVGGCLCYLPFMGTSQTPLDILKADSQKKKKSQMVDESMHISFEQDQSEHQNNGSTRRSGQHEDNAIEMTKPPTSLNGKEGGTATFTIDDEDSEEKQPDANEPSVHSGHLA